MSVRWRRNGDSCTSGGNRCQAAGDKSGASVRVDVCAGTQHHRHPDHDHERRPLRPRQTVAGTTRCGEDSPDHCRAGRSKHQCVQQAVRCLRTHRLGRIMF
jgi:hypothetical protein